MTRKEENAFIDRIAPAAQAAAVAHGIPASVTIAQAILESGWGAHAPGNNFFGIKKGAANKPYVDARNGAGDPEARSNYRAFKSLEECFDEHGRLLRNDDRYASAMADADNPLIFARRLQECRYAQDPNYGAELNRIMRSYDLVKKYDLQNGRAG